MLTLRYPSTKARSRGMVDASSYFSSMIKGSGSVMEMSHPLSAITRNTRCYAFHFAIHLATRSLLKNEQLTPSTACRNGKALEMTTRSTTALNLFSAHGRRSKNFFKNLLLYQCASSSSTTCHSKHRCFKAKRQSPDSQLRHSRPQRSFMYGHEMAVLLIDAHADRNTPSTSPTKA
ncbi:uncharacterized protein Aud_003936 [Aspergillus udagawae]|uniref:Uncharacterized protein n=1 Tax=Aspergillus udagawae TaxID=91492 RepID=A0A8E0UVN0_9EURO|nr:uncharacterized protein Aud_003936 [Aspergillus udagawae]GIC87552.1 hypothetical protein Aud_003936 [Aspergillus udagawae]